MPAEHRRPLTKRERTFALIAFVLLVACAVLTFGFMQERTKNPASFAQTYPLVDPARAQIEQQHFFSTIQPLREELYEIVDESAPNSVGIYFEFLNTGSNVSINQEQRFWPASLSKMPTALAVMKKVERGDWNLGNELVLFYEDREPAFGDLYKEPAGTRLTIERLMQELLIHSDDTAHRILIRNLEGADFEDMLEALGMEALYDNNYNITAKEYSRIFRSLYASSYLDAEYSQKLLSWLSTTPFDEFLASGLPEGTLFSHKIGEHDPTLTYLDSGIVYLPNRPYLLTVMVQVKDEGGRERAKELMRRISEAAYDYVANY